MTYSVDPEDPDPTHACDRLLIGPYVVTISQGPPVVRKKPNARMTELDDAYFDAGMTPAQMQPLLAGKVLLGEDPPSWKWLRNRYAKTLINDCSYNILSSSLILVFSVPWIIQFEISSSNFDSHASYQEGNIEQKKMRLKVSQSTLSPVWMSDCCRGLLKTP
jgi:hypothetical protein